MKKIISLLIILWTGSFYCYPQAKGHEQGSETGTLITQVRKPVFLSIPVFQSLNRASENIAFARQSGNQNSAVIRQMTNQEFGRQNQVFSLQSGSWNEFFAEQIGSGNLINSVQSAYLTNLQNLELISQSSFAGAESWSLPGGNSNIQSVIQEGDNNCLSSLQQGSNNNIKALQNGYDNSISAAQFGDNNNLSLTQNGNNNVVTGYVQENQSGKMLSDKISQNGDHLTFISHDASKYKANANSFSQTGINLTLEVNNSLLNSIGGVEINQTGKDMKVIVDQSYFSTH